MCAAAEARGDIIKVNKHATLCGVSLDAEKKDNYR